MQKEGSKNNDQEIQNILEDIKGSGLPLEIEVSSKLKESNWAVMIHDYYIDEDEGKNREIDIGAYRRLDFDTPDFSHIHISLIIECKKSSDKPWVFFTAEKGREFEYPQFLIKTMGKPRIHKDLLSQKHWMEKSHYFCQKFQKYAIIPYEPFTEGKGRRIFEGSMQVVKALTYQMKQTAKYLRFIGGNPLNLMYPIIVFDGHLFEYDSGKLTRAKYLQYLVNHKFTDPLINELVGDAFLIDIFTKDFLHEYLEMLTQEIDEIKSSLASWSS